MRTTLLFACVITLIGLTCAWHDMGHVMVASIAMKQLSKSHISNLNSLMVSYSPHFDKTLLTLPYCATFMDYIKKDTSLFDPLHYVQNPYQISGDFVAPQPQETSAIKAITDPIRSLINASNETMIWPNSFSLLSMIHVVGDIHQPLHAANLYSEQFPNGDLGGNLYKITYENEFGRKYDQMHMLFDAVGGLFTEYMPIPMTNSFRDMINLEVEKLLEEFPMSSFTKEELTPNISDKRSAKKVIKSWANESLELAKLAYDSIPQNQPVSKDNVSWVRSVLKKRIALGGYRLGYLLNMVDTTKRGSEPNTSTPLNWKMVCIGVFIAFALAILAVIRLYTLTVKKEKSFIGSEGFPISPERNNDPNEDSIAHYA